MSTVMNDGIIAIQSFQEKYSFKKKLGKGGYCDVFLAEHKKTGKKVAIKMLEMNPASEMVSRRAERFRREMYLYSQLDHPNIVTVMDSGETETGVLFIVTEFIAGQTLAQLLRKEGALSVSRTMSVMKQILAALQTAHGKGIIHRDLKPENIMIVAEGASEKVKILDFGISTFIASQCGDFSRLTATKEFLGTPTYAAPEQLRGEPITQKVDIYSWGLLLLECMTGKLPFAGTSVAAVVQQQLSPAPIPIPTALNDHRLGTLLRWTLEKDAHRRAGSCAIIASHLENIPPESITQQNGFLSVETPSGTPLRASDIAIYETVASTQERRQVTVVCFSLSIQERNEHQSADVLDEIYQDIMTHGYNLFQKFGAHVMTDAGDRILAYFGYPDASDTDARCAARGSLELATAMARRSVVFSNQQGIQLSYRMGIHTGIIHVRKGTDGRNQLSGLTANIVGKLCAMAEANSIYLSESSYALLNDFVECGEVPIEALSERIPGGGGVYRVAGERRIEGLAGMDDAALLPMVGRDGELARLNDMWKTMGKRDGGRAVLLQGEAGIGKSRLAAEFARAVLKTGGGWMECRCLPEAKNSALHPILEFLAINLGLRRASSPQQAFGMLETHLGSFGMDLSLAMPLFCAWFGIPNESYPVPSISPQRQKEYVLTFAAEILVRLASASSSVIMIEDLHWVDPTTLELIQKLFEQVKMAGIFLLMSARPVFSPPWKSHEAETLTLNGLDDGSAERIIRTIGDSAALAAETVAKIVARADGIPLFIEEMTRMICEHADSKDDIPSTIRDLLTGKIDRLGPAKETVQLASVIGRTFDYDLIEKLSLKDAASLLADLDQLVSAGLLHARLRVGNPEYSFHHALIRDSAYESLSPKTKMEIHLRIAQTLEREYGEIVINHPEIIGRHWAGAGEYEKATACSIQAASHYLMKSLYGEAIRNAAESLEWVRRIKDDARKIDGELQLLQLLMPAYISSKGFAAPELEPINARTEELRGKLPENSAFLTPILWGKVIYYEATPDYPKLEYYLNESLAIGEKLNNIDLLSALYSVKSHYCSSHGELTASIKNADISLDYYKNKRLASHGMVFGHDSKVLSLALKALALTVYGDLYSASVFMEEAIEFATSINDPSSKGQALSYRLCMLHARNEKIIIGTYCDQFRDFINRYGLELWRNVVEFHSSWATDDIEKAKQCLTIFRYIGFGQLAPYWNFIAAQEEYARGLFGDSLHRVETYIRYSYDVGEIFYLPELYRLKALCIARIAPEKVKDIEASFKKACDHADTAKANLFKLRALLDFYKTVSDRVIRNYCIDELRKTIGIFEGFNRYMEHYEVKEAVKIASEGIA